MSLSFFPRKVKFFELFKQQNALLVSSIGMLHEIFQDYKDVARKGGNIIKDEIAGNEISREITRELSLTFITPLDREDIHNINSAQEDVLNSVRYISTRLGLYRFEQVKPGAVDLISKIKQMITEISVMIDKLSSRHEVKENAAIVQELKREADTLLLVLMGEVFETDHHSNSELMELLKWSQVYDKIEDALANTEILANTLEGISLKNA